MVPMPRDPRYSQLQRALTEVRQGNGLTQQEVASRVGKPQSFVSKYESGERRLDVVEWLDVCAALRVEPASIIQRLHHDGE